MHIRFSAQRRAKQLNNSLVAHSVGVCRNNQVPCKVLNFTPHEVFISRGRYVAQCSVIPKTTPLGFLGTASATHATDNYLCTLNAETTPGGDYDPINDLSEDQVWEKMKTLNISISNPALSDYQRLQFAKLILKNQDLFASKVEDIGRCDFIEHDIKLTDPTPITQQSFRHSPEVNDIINQKVQQYLKAGIVRPSSSPFNTNLLAVRKPSGEYRVVADMKPFFLKMNFNLQSIPSHHQIILLFINLVQVMNGGEELDLFTGPTLN